MQWYFNRVRDTHDLFHVLTTYGRDAMGEACLLGFSYSQNYNKGALFIGYAGAREIKKISGTKAPLLSAVREGQRLGKAAGKIVHEDIEALMREDIDEARARLGIGQPVIYRECLRQLEREGNVGSDLGVATPKAA
ncbi:MAG: Coq4 family protein [Pseudomonadota bacterium]